ncbi:MULTISPECIES: hypothetical protein [Curtobacterium]|jgi:hypothetical protein|uniref:Uncharacterized protein n=1 Tax=Curtobacterium citri TaxID=3055139 RepID=A0ABT7T6U5_9MICO|nr:MULTISPECIES: hypothetical protein [Curtobacterium]MDM7885298.1 hypothetical protein [Curtobacterium citri]
MDPVLLLTIAGIVVAVLGWTARFLGWTSVGRRHDVPDPSGTMQGSTTPSDGTTHGHHSGSDLGGGHHG